jgi:cytidylate kinase
MDNRSNIVIAIDGPAASGKGSLARVLAKELGFDFLDTGALYRRVALKVIEQKIDETDGHAVAQAARDLESELGQGYDDDALRTDLVGQTASIVAQNPAVRETLLQYQRNFAKNAPKGAVLDGRDIGTVICPDADLKLYVTATAEKRAERRSKELQSRGIDGMYAQVLAEMQERDARDAPRLKEHMAPGNNAHIIDTSDMTPKEVLDKAMILVMKEIPSLS